MAISIQELTAVVSARITDFSQKMVEAGSHATEFGTKFATVAKGVSASATAVTVSIGAIATAATAAAMKVIGASEEQRKAQARLAAVFKATGNAAGVTTKQVLEFAAARQQVTNFGDEVTVQGAAVLATFKSIQGEAFFRTMTLAQDLAELMGGDLQGAVLQLGKALENPTTGLTALRRAGISFTEEQKAVIQALVESNRTLEAQGMILQVVEGQIGGVASAAASPLTQFQNMMSDVAEDIGTAILPAFKEFAASVTEVVQNNKGQIIEMAKSFFDFGLAITKLATQHPKLASLLALISAGQLAGINRGLIDLAAGFLNVGKGAAGMAKAAFDGASVIGKIGMAANVAKAGLVGLALTAIAGISVAIYKAMPSIRAWNKELERGAELNKKIADNFAKRQQAIVDQANKLSGKQREDFLNEQLETAQKNLAGLEASLAGARKQVEDYSNGWREFTGNKVLADFENQVTETEAALERQKGLIEALKAEQGGGGVGFAPPTPGQPGGAEIDVETKDEAKTRKKEEKTAAKTAEEHADDVKAATESVRDFGIAIHDLRDKLSQRDMEAFASSAEQLKGQLEGGAIDLDEFKFRMGQLDEEMKSLAQTTEKMLEFGAGLNDLRDKLAPATLDAAAEAAGRLRDQLESGEITADQFDAGLKRINDTLQGFSAANEFQTEVEKSNLTDGDVQSFNEGLSTLKALLASGDITIEQFNGRLDHMREELQAATFAEDAFNKFVQAQQKIPAAGEVVSQFGEKIAALQEKFLRGEISMDQFRSSIGKLEDQAAKAAEQARLQALARGDLKGAGLNFDKAVQDKLLQTQAGFVQQQFDQQVQMMVNAMMGVSDAAMGLGNNLVNVGQQFTEFGDQMQGFSVNVQGGGEKAGQAMSSLAQYLNSKEGMIASIQNQISSLQQFLSLSSLDYQKRAAILAQIDALAAQLQSLLRTPPPVLSPWHGDPNFRDPGLDDGVNRDPHRRTRSLNDVHIHSIFPPSAGDKRMLMDAIIDELQRSGYSL